jgi:hypothetical protein
MKYRLEYILRVPDGTDFRLTDLDDETFDELIRWATEPSWNTLLHLH